MSESDTTSKVLDRDTGLDKSIGAVFVNKPAIISFSSDFSTPVSAFL